MRKFALTLLLSVALIGVAVAEDEAPTALKRGFLDGKFVDEYFGIAYAADGLKEGLAFGSAGRRTLFSGKLTGSADVELICNESSEELTSVQWRDKVKALMDKDDKTRTEMATADDPVPSITFVQESFAGFERPHGYAFYARGHQCFVVHVQVREKNDASAGLIQKGLQGLTVAPSSDSMLLVHIVSKGMGKPLDDVNVLIRAGNDYLQEGQENVPLALRVLGLVQARESELDDAQRYVLYRTLGFVQLKAKKHEDAIGTWKKVIELSAKTNNPGAAASNAQYNLACALSLHGRLDEGIEALKAAFATGSEAEIAGLKRHAREDTDLANLRADARWAEVVGTGDEE